MLGHILEPVWEGLKILRVNAKITVRFTEGTAKIEITELRKSDGS